MPGTHVEADWHRRRYQAWRPDPLTACDLAISTPTARRTERAVAALQTAEARLPMDWEPLARLLLRNEGIASSSIEGLTVPLPDVVAAELIGGDGDAGWIADNLTVVDAALAAATDPLDVDLLHEWHHDLMAHSRLPAELVGRFRDAPSWIGGSSPIDAVYVPPPAALVPALMADLVAFANTSGIDPITQAAVAHAQFETIHPYGDGNGRLGRILIGWILRRRGVVSNAPAPLSVLIAKDPGGYLAGLYEFREGSLDRWVAWFADTVIRTGRATESMIEDVGELVIEWGDRLVDVRADATARRVIARLPGHPLVAAPVIREWFGVSSATARETLLTLVDHGILERHGGPPARGRGRPVQWYLATEVVGLAAGWAR